MPQSPDEIKAQQKFFQRANGPVIGARSTYGTQPNKLFRENQEQGRLPRQYKSWDDAEQQFLEEIKKGVKPAAARKKLGLTYENVLGHPYFDVVVDRYTGETRGFNKRAVNEDLHPLAERDLRLAYGKQTADGFRGQLKDGWGDYKKKASYDPMAISSQDEAKAVREYLTSFLGRGDPRDQGNQIHRGHGFSASQAGGSLNLMDLFPELGWTNVHGHQGLAGNPRMHPDDMYDNNMASTAEQGFFFDLLDREGNTINPRATQWPGTFIAVDENANEIRKKVGPMNYDVGPAVEQNPGVSSGALAAQQRRRDELMAQMGQAGPRQAINQANSQSIIMDNTQSVGTPLRIVRDGTPVQQAPKPAKVTVVSPDGSERKLTTPGSSSEQIVERLVGNGVPLDRAQEIATRMRPIPNKPRVIPAPSADTINLPSIPKLTTGGLVSGGVLSLLMGESPAQAFASNIPILSDIEADNNGMAERAGQLFVDPRTNRLMPTNVAEVGKGLAYLNGKPVVVPYGSVAGIKSNGEIAKESVRQIADVNSKRLSKVTSAAAPVLKKASQYIPKPLSPFQPLVDAYRGFNKIIANIVRD